jgi:WXG100 family type VII secretion target
MAQAIMDPEEVRKFASELKRFNQEIQTRMSSLQARFAALGSSWQDQEHDKFSEEFVQTMKALKKFVEISEKHAPLLLRKAQRIEQYLDQR